MNFTFKGGFPRSIKTFPINLNYTNVVAGPALYTDKKRKKILIYKEIQSGAVAKSYMRKGFLIMRKCANI
jgi:hypothetical protein